MKYRAVINMETPRPTRNIGVLLTALLGELQTGLPGLRVTYSLLEVVDDEA